MKPTKKLWSIVLCACLLMTLLCAVSVTADTTIGAEEFVKNGSFETPKSAEDGTGAAGWNLSGAAEAVSEGEADANRYIQLVTNDDAQAIATQTAANINGLAGGQTYVLSFRYKTGTKNDMIRITRYEKGGGEISGGSYTGGTTGSAVNADMRATNGSWENAIWVFTTDATTDAMDLQIRATKTYDADATTNTVCIDDVSLKPITFDGGNLYSVVYGGETSTEEAFEGADCVAVAAGAKAHVQMASTELAVKDLVKVSGYVKAATGTTIKVDVKIDNAGATVVKTKTIAANGNWQPFQFSGVEKYNQNVVVTVEAVGGVAYADAFSIAKDLNLLTDGSFEEFDTTNPEKNWGYLAASAIVSGADAPDGVNYVKISQEDTNVRRVYHKYSKVVQAGHKYLLSAWYKSNIADVASKEPAIRWEIEDSNGGKGNIPKVLLSNTNGEWKKVELIIEIPEVLQLEGGATSTISAHYLYLDHKKNALAAGDYIAFDGLSLVELPSDGGNLALYKQTGTVAERYGNVGTFLGEAVDTAKDATALSAAYVTGGTDKMVVLAAYKTDANNAKQLVSVQIANGMSTLSDIPADCEIRAFAWDSLSGMNPTQTYIKTTN